MIKRHYLLLGILSTITLLAVAATQYPGGSQADSTALGYDWKNNYISNLFGEQAVNGASNPGRYWAMAGMFLLSVSLALFFVSFAKKIPQKRAAQVLKYTGISGMVFAFLIATPLHDVMIPIASTLFLIGIFYCTVFVFKSKLRGLQFLSAMTLLSFYLSLYCYGSGDLREYLPVLQKITFLLVVFLVLALEYFTKKEDFEKLLERTKSK